MVAAKPGSERPESDTVTFTVNEGIAWVKFNRPEKRNCMNPKLNRQMMRVLDELESRSAGVEVREERQREDESHDGSAKGNPARRCNAPMAAGSTYTSSSSAGSAATG